MSEHAQYVTLGVAGETFAIPVAEVQEILDTQPISRLPQSPANVLGMIDVRGQTVPVVDLRLTLGLAALDDSDTTRIVVMAMTGPAGEHRLGVRTDRVFEVTALDDDALEPAPALSGQWQGHCIVGIGRRNGGFVTVIDFGKMMGGVPLAAQHLSSGSLQ
jgi:purine-binding chemotaxis protein CheW